MIVYNNNSAWTAVYLGNQQISKVHSSQAKVWPEEPQSYKYSLYDANGDLVISGACDTSTTITQAEVINYQTPSVSAYIGECCDTLGEGVFSGWTNLTSVTISSAVRYIRPYAFRYCSNLANVTIPDDLREIGHNVFHGCTSLVSVTLPSGLTSLGDMVFLDCTGLTSVNIPEGLSKIPQHTFNKCYSLSAMTIPSGITEIAYEAFYKCSGLTSVTVLATTPPTLGNSVFDFTTCQIFVPCDSVEAYKSAPNWSNYASRIMPIAGSCPKVRIEYKNQMASPTVIDCSASTVVNVQETYNAMPEGNRYFGQQNASALTIGGCATSIEDSVFMSFTALTTVQLSDSLTSIGNDVFDNCKSLTSITFPDSVLSIGSSVCHSCSALTSATLPSGMTSVPDSAFAYCHSLSAFDFDGITSIGRSAFFQCSGMTSITLPSGLASIADTAFYQCKSLTSITCLATTPPTLGSSVFSLTNDCAIYVPSGSVSAYQSASGWSTYASRIQAIPTD